MTKYPRLAAVCFGIAIALAATPSAWATDKPVMAVKPPAPQQPINPGVVLAQPVTLKPALNLSNYNPSTSYSNSQASASNRAQATGGAAYSSVSIEADQRRIPVSTAIAPSINPTANCAIPVTGGVSVPSISISGGSAYESETCITIEQAKVATNTFHDHETGEELMCGLEKYRAARKAVNRPCKADIATTKAAEAQPVEPTDPIVRRRLGLAPL